MEYKLITKERFDDVINHLRVNFFADEPLNKAAGLCKKGAGNIELEKLSYETLESNLSLMAVNDKNEICGVILNGVLYSGHLERVLSDLELNDFDKNFKKIFRLLYTFNLKVDLFQNFEIDKIFDLRILSVDSRFRGQGIAKELVKRSEELAKQNSFKLMKADATGIFSQKILHSSGFEVLLEQYYSKYTDEQGKPILPVEAPHLKLQLLIKHID